MNKILLSFFICFAFFGNGISQTAPIENCASDIMMEKFKSKTPEINNILLDNEKKIQQIISKRKLLKTTNNVYTIPLVIHIVHLGEAVGVGNNISDDQILSGIKQLNDVYGNVNGSSIDLGIQFELAKLEESCITTNGIIRVNGSVVSGYSTKGVNVSNSDGADEETIKDLSRWSNTDYYNIWLVSEFDNNDGGGGIQGFAYFPGTSSSLDGAMIMNTAWGNIGTVNSWNNLGSTGIHEMGHALGLYHTFEGDKTPVTLVQRCPPSATGCGFYNGDCCDDTSPHIRSISDCATSATNTCTGKTNDDVIHNYMDYSSQDCQYLFTLNQKERMIAFLESTRKGLITSKALNASISFASPIATSCTPTTSETGMSGLFLGILNVEFRNLSNTSNYAAAEGGYADFSSACLKAAEVDRDSSYYLKVSVGANTNHTKAWIDYDNDGVFSDVTELVFNKNINAEKTDSVLVTIPSSALNDTYLRMRVMNDFGANSVKSSCHNPTYGQAEDYSVLVSSILLNTPKSPSSTVNNYIIAPNPFNDFIQFSYTNENRLETLYTIIDLSGTIIIQGIIPASDVVLHFINTNQLKAGSYILNLQNQNFQKSEKLIKVY